MTRVWRNPLVLAKKSKEEILSVFRNDVNVAAKEWINFKVNPYSRAYADARHYFKSTIDDQQALDQLETDIFVSVAMLVGTAAFAWAPVAGLVATGSRGMLKTIVRLSPAAQRIGVNRQVAARIMANIVFGSAKAMAEVAKGPGLDHLKSQHAKVSSRVFASSGGSNHAATRGWVRPNASGDPPPALMYYLELVSLVEQIASEMHAFERMLYNDTTCDQAVALKCINWLYHQKFMAECPRQSIPDLPGLANKMEKCLWAMWACNLKDVRTINCRHCGPVKRTLYKAPGYHVEQRLAALDVSLMWQGKTMKAGEFFGGYLNPTTYHERRELVNWAEKLLKDHAETAPFNFRMD